MIVDQIHVAGIAGFKPKDDTPVAADRNGPEARQVSLQGMETPTGQAHVAGLRRLVQPGQNALDLAGQVGADPAPVALVVEAFQALVTETLNRMISVTLHLSRSKRVTAGLVYGHGLAIFPPVS